MKNIDNDYSMIEYDDLKNHIQMLLRSLYSNGIAVITCMVAIWLIAFKCVDIKDFGNFNYVILRLSLSCLLFEICTFICYPLFKKECEILDSIASIASYIKVFYEAPSVIFKSRPIFWETITGRHKFTSNNKKMHRLFNAEYFAISLFSSLMSFALIVLIYYFLANKKIALSFPYILFAIFLTIIFIIQIILFILIIKISKVSKMGEILNEYLEKYLNEAFELNIFPNNYKKEFEDLVKPKHVENSNKNKKRLNGGFL